MDAKIKKIIAREVIHIICLFFIIFLTCSTALASYEVKGKGVSSTMYIEGKATTSKSEDEVVYVVDIDNKKVIRTGVFNAGIKDGPLSGLQADNTIYQIVYDEECLMMKDKQSGDSRSKSQHIIKAVGKAGMSDGYETIVIGEDFITTSISKYNYFVLYYYKRMQ